MVTINLFNASKSGVNNGWLTGKGQEPRARYNSSMEDKVIVDARGMERY